MKFKPILRRIGLLPISPPFFRAITGLLRFLGVLPQRVSPEWPPLRVLIVNITGNLGDAMMMMPLVDALHEALPGTMIDLLVESPLHVPLRAIPYIRHVYRFDRDARRIPLLSYYLRIYRMIQFARRNLRDEDYDLALLPRWGTDPSLSFYLAAMSSAGRRAGHDPEEEVGAEAVFQGMASLLTDVSHGGAGLAEGVREKQLLVSCGLIQEFSAATEERHTVSGVIAMGDSADAIACMQKLGMSSLDSFILLAPGASHPLRCWPPDRFAKLGEELFHNTGYAIYSIGGPGDRVLGEQIEELSGGVIKNVAGETSIVEVIALTQRAKLVVSNDSGPAHVGGSVGAPTLVLSACPKTSKMEHANSPLRVRPVGPHVRVIQPEDVVLPCTERCVSHEAHCILGLTNEIVLRSALELLDTGT